MSRKPGARRSDCPISISLEIFGDRWTLLVVRDLMFKGRATFREFLEAGEGIATNILADRLAQLEEHGLVERRAHPEDGRRNLYRLTEKGVDLAPLLVDMVLWAARYEDTAAPADEVRRMWDARSEFLAEIRARWAAADPI